MDQSNLKANVWYLDHRDELVEQLGVTVHESRIYMSFITPHGGIISIPHERVREMRWFVAEDEE
jgi:hypothetical protein